MKSCFVVWCIVIASACGSVVKRDTKNFSLPTCPERAVCSIIKETGSGPDGELESTNTCECPGDHVCPKEPGDQTLAVNKGEWFGLCQPTSELSTCTDGEVAQDLFVSADDAETDYYTKVNCICPSASEDSPQSSEVSTFTRDGSDSAGSIQFVCPGTAQKRGRGKPSSFYKRSAGRNSGMSSFYKRGRYGDTDKSGRFYFYKRDSDDEALAGDDDNSMEKRGRYGAKDREGNFYFYKRGQGMSSFYKRSPQNGMSSFYKRGRWGDNPNMSSFYKRQSGDSMSSFYKRGGNYGMSSFYKRADDSNDQNEMDKRGRYGDDSDKGRFYFYKRGRYGQDDKNGRFYFYKRGGRFGNGRDKQKFYFY